MATPKQQQIAREIVKDIATGKPKTKKKVLESVGYSKSTAESHTGKIFKSEGVKEELVKLGFSLDEADNVVGEILQNSEQDTTRIRAAQEVYKRLGGYAPEKSAHMNINVTAHANNPEVQKLSEEFEEKLKQLNIDKIKSKHK